MKIVALMGEKGGTGRSMLAVQLAVAALTDGRSSCVLTTTPQGTVLEWGAQRCGDGASQSCRPKLSAKAVGQSCQPNTAILTGPPADSFALAKRLGYVLAFVDCGRNTEFQIQIARAAALVLLPFRPALPDIRSMLTYTGPLHRLRTPRVLAVCNAARAGTSEAKEALEFLAEDGQVRCASTVIYDRVLFRRTFAAGRGVAEMGSKSKAKDEIIALYQELVL